MGSAELSVIGLTCCLVGVFFLANSIIFRKLRNVIAVFFGVRSRSLSTIKDYTLNNLQVALGFMFLTLGFLLEIYARLEGLEAVAEGASGNLLLICVAIVVMAILTFLAGAAYSRRSFKKYLRLFFQKHPEAFNRDVTLTKEIGEYLGIPHTQESTVEEYLERVRKALRMPPEEEARSPAQERGRRLLDRGAVPGRGILP